ncbi:hypothetical protein ON010_g7767 [Phytophthora cinnamomi]|nr:hypothetical protein ON010_g7767 [Phytophthora cinnamomi]
MSSLVGVDAESALPIGGEGENNRELQPHEPTNRINCMTLMRGENKHLRPWPVVNDAKRFRPQTHLRSSRGPCRSGVGSYRRRRLQRAQRADHAPQGRYCRGCHGILPGQLQDRVGGCGQAQPQEEGGADGVRAPGRLQRAGAHLAAGWPAGAAGLHVRRQELRQQPGDHHAGQGPEGHPCRGEG